MKNKTLAIIIAIIAVIAIVSAVIIIYIAGNRQAAALEENATVEEGDYVAAAFSETSATGCSLIKNDVILREMCDDSKKLRAARNEKNPAACNDTEFSFIRWSPFMCGFLETPTIEYCNERAYRINMDPSLCPGFVAFVSGNGGGENLGDSIDIALFSKAFYLSDKRQCSKIKEGALYEINLVEYDIVGNPPTVGPPLGNVSVGIDLYGLCPLIS